MHNGNKIFLENKAGDSSERANRISQTSKSSQYSIRLEAEPLPLDAAILTIAWSTVVNSLRSNCPHVDYSTTGYVSVLTGEGYFACSYQSHVSLSLSLSFARTEPNMHGTFSSCLSFSFYFPLRSTSGLDLTSALTDQGLPV